MYLVLNLFVKVIMMYVFCDILWYFLNLHTCLCMWLYFMSSCYIIFHCITILQFYLVFCSPGSGLLFQFLLLKTVLLWPFCPILLQTVFLACSQCWEQWQRTDSGCWGCVASCTHLLVCARVAVGQLVLEPCTAVDEPFLKEGLWGQLFSWPPRDIRPFPAFPKLTYCPAV